jgi:hypothetical protein
VALAFVGSEPLLCRLSGSSQSKADRRPRMARSPRHAYASTKHNLCDFDVLVGLDDLTELHVPFGESCAHVSTLP